MSFKNLIEHLFKNYIEAKCRCLFKEGNEPSLVMKDNTIPYYISNQKPNLAALATLLCRNMELAKSMYIAFIFSKVYSNKLNWCIGYELVKIFTNQERYNGFLLFFYLNGI